MKRMAAPFIALAILMTPLPALAAGCGAVAQEAASQRGAEVIKVVADKKNGRTICKITLRIPGSNGQPPRVETVEMDG